MRSVKSIKICITKKDRETREKMVCLGTFRKEFETSIRRYAELSVQYDILTETWYENGCKVTEKYTNKNGATNQRKTALYLSMETMRKELIDMENLFGLTPKGLKAIKTKGLETTKKTALDKALERMSEESG